MGHRGVLIALAITGCSESETAAPEPTGVLCDAPTIALPDGSCVAPGIPPEHCARGFEPDEGPACRAVLPEQKCASGTMAIPGETTCRSVAPCGSGRWGDIPIDATTRFVDARYAGGDGDGSEAK